MWPFVVSGAVSMLFMLVGLAWWPFYLLRGDRWLKAKVAKRFEVEIGIGARGHWDIAGGGTRGCLIEMIQLAGFMGAFVVWATWIGIGLLIVHFVQP